MKKEGLTPRIKSNYIKIYIFSIILWIVPLTIINYSLKFVSVSDNWSDYKTYNADMLIQDDYINIDVNNVKKNHGMVQVVTKDLHTIVLCGQGIFPDGTITEKQWVDYLINVASEQKDTSDSYYSMSYSEAGEYWLIVSYDSNLLYSLTINNHTYKGENISGMIMILIILSVAIGSYIVGMIILIYFFSYRTTNQLVQQIKALKQYTAKLKNGEYNTRIESPMYFEILELKEAFNELAHSLDKERTERKQLENSKKRLLLDVSHDLNNPIATIRSCSEILIKKDSIAPELKKKYYEIMNNNSIRAYELMSDLFEYVKMDEPNFTLNKKVVDLCEFMRQQILHYQPEFETKQMKLESELPDKINVNMDIIQMKKVVNNILTNAMKYNKPGTTVIIKIIKLNSKINLIIKDDGIGLDANVAKTIFEPFVRVDEARNSKTGGSGLGLTIVKQILDTHGFSIDLVTDVNQGCCFIIEIPNKSCIHEK